MSGFESRGQFHLDLIRYQLREGSRAVRLERQPMELLSMLARRKGELVTREEIAKALWPRDVHVDFDQSINRIVRKVRVALRDDSDVPRFVETVVGKGYRFIGPIEVIERSPARPGDIEPQLAATTNPRSKVSKIAAGFALGVAPMLVIGVWLTRDSPPARALTISPITAFLGDEWYTSFAPDDRRFSFAWSGETRGNWDIYVKELDSMSPPRRLTDEPGIDTMPSWSPDGRAIAFVHQRAEKFALRIMPASGGPAREVASDLTAAPDQQVYHAPSWSPDGQWILSVDVINRDEATSRILVVASNGTVRRHLEPGGDPAAFYAYPIVAPDGTTLAYDSCTAAGACTTYVVPIGRDLQPIGRPRAITRDGHLARGMVWTADSTAVVYGDGLRRGLFRVRVADGSLERIEVAGPSTMFPAVSRSGDRLAYTRIGRDWNLWKMSAGGTSAPEDFLSSTLFDTDPAFASDGRIAFASDRDGNGRQIWVADRDGTRPVALTPGTGRVQGSPQWSPDGRWIAYDSQEPNGQRAVYVVGALGGAPRRMTTHPWSEHRPSWSRDGAWIYFTSTKTGRAEIWRVPSAGGEGVQVTSAGGYEVRESADSRTLFYMKGMHGSLFERSVAGGPERQVVEAIFRSNFEVTKKGIYYTTRPDPAQSPDGLELRLLDLSTRRTTVLNRFDAIESIGVSVSADGRTVITSGVRTSSSSDLWLIQNFR